MKALATGLAVSLCISTSSSSCLGTLILFTCRGRQRSLLATTLKPYWGGGGGGGGGGVTALTHSEHSLGLSAGAHVGVVDVLEHHPGLVVFAVLEKIRDERRDDEV